MINYCNEAQVASALNLPPTGTLASPVIVGATTISITTSGTYYPGQRLALDHFQDDTVGEVVFIKSISGTTYTLVSPAINAHVAGAPIVEVTAITKVLASASRSVDDLTYYTNVGFNQETVTDNIRAYIQNDGNILIPAKKPIVNSVTSLIIQNTPIDIAYSIPIGNLDINGYIVTAYIANTAYVPPVSSREVRATLVYSGGYNTLPSDIVRSAIVLAARFYKEKDSGFSDVIGNVDLGIMQYKKGAPAEVMAMLKNYIRVTV
jgi:hypothetical protein